jgi:hypothetical protein
LWLAGVFWPPPSPPILPRSARHEQLHCDAIG